MKQTATTSAPARFARDPRGVTLCPCGGRIGPSKCCMRCDASVVEIARGLPPKPTTAPRHQPTRREVQHDPIAARYQWALAVNR